MPVKPHAPDKLVSLKVSILVNTDTCNKHTRKRGYQHSKNKNNFNC